PCSERILKKATGLQIPIFETRAGRTARMRYPSRPVSISCRECIAASPASPPPRRKQLIDSRLYGGIHFRSANEDGLRSGLRIGDWTLTHYLQPKGNRSRK